MTIEENICLSIQSGDAVKTEKLISRALREDIPPAKILREGMAAGIMEAEKRLQKNEILDSEYLICERALQAGLYILQSVLSTHQNEFMGTIITGTLEGDIRETGKDLSACLMQSLGLRVIDLGSSISGFRFIEAAIEEKAQLIFCTTQLAMFLPLMKSLVISANQTKIRSRTKILLSGNPVTEWFCESINADMYAPDLIQAADMAAGYCQKIAGMRERLPGDRIPAESTL